MAISAMEASRRNFFDYFRQRLGTARRDDIALPDRLFLLSGCLDALAKHWLSTADHQRYPHNLKGDERMRAFLVQHGGHAAFSKVSAPMLFNATGREVGAFPFSSYKPYEMNEVRDWQDDPDYSDAATSLDPATLIRWSYPGILYVDLRCAWVHNFVHENEDIDIRTRNYFGREEPFYRYVSPGFTPDGQIQPDKPGRFLLILPVPFLLATVQRAIDSFELEADARDIAPLAGS
jgi:hypothetical protein